MGIRDFLIGPASTLVPWAWDLCNGNELRTDGGHVKHAFQMAFFQDEFRCRFSQRFSQNCQHTEIPTNFGLEVAAAIADRRGDGKTPCSGIISLCRRNLISSKPIVYYMLI